MQQMSKSSLPSPSDHSDNSFMILYGPLAPKGAIASLGPLRRATHKGKARLFADHKSTLNAIMNRDLISGDILIHKSEELEDDRQTQIRSLMDLIEAITASGAQKIILISEAGAPPQEFLKDHKGQALISHLTPKAQQGGPLSKVKDGHWIIIDPMARTLTHLSDDMKQSVETTHSQLQKTMSNPQKIHGPSARYDSLFINP